MTPIEIISTSIAVVALIVTWLTRQDSKKMANEARRANDLLARQLELSTNEQKRQLEKEQSESRPVVDWKGGGDYMPYGGTSRWHFRNLGGTVTSLKIKTEAEKISVTINPTNIQNTFLTNDEGDIVFQFEKGPSPLLLPLVFTLSCVTRLGEQWEKKFKLTGDKNPAGTVIPSRVVEA
jgi:hypothetical protein